MIGLLIASLAAEAGTLRDAHVYDAGTVVEDVAVAPDGRTFAFLETGKDRLWVVRTDTWKAYPAKSCSGLVGLGAYQNGYAVGCGDGSIAFVDTSLRKPGPEPAIVPEVAGTPILGVTADATNVYVVAENEKSGGNPVMLAVSIEGRARLEKGWPATLGYPGYLDSETDGQYVIVSHGADNVSKVDVATGSASVALTGVGYADCKDVDATELSALLACQIGLVEFEPNTSDLQLVLGSHKEWFHVESLWIDELEDKVWFFDSQDGLFVYGYDSETGTVTDDLIGAVPDPHGSSEMAGVPGYAFLGTDGGDVHVYTQLPWVDVEEIPEPALNGQVVDVTFTSDIEGDYQVMFGETVLAEGRVLADEAVTVPVAITEAFIEGENTILVSVIDDAGDQGHGGVSVIVNNPPSQVELQEGDLGWGDSKLFLTFGGIDDEDLVSYGVYWSATKFEPGPGAPPGAAVLDVPAEPGQTIDVEIEGLTNEVTYYVAVRAFDATLEGPMSVVLSGTPHETFTAAELSGDDGGYGCGSTRSRAPIAALILVGLAAIGRRGAVAALALLALSGAARAQDEETDDTSTETDDTSTETDDTSTTETSTTATTPTTTATTPTTTTTTTTTTPTTPSTPETPATVVVEQPVPGTVTVVKSEKTPWVHAGLELRFGPLWFDGNNPLNDVYGESGNNLLMLEAGPSIKDVLQLEFGVGRYHRRGHLVSEDGEQSNDESVITLYPLTVGARVRLDFIREQWIVPTAAAGLDYWLWSEKAGYDTDSLSWDAKRSGGHYGYHYAAGLQILLDAFEPKRASQLQARAGIEDSYLVAEYRHREVGEEEDGLKFTGSEITVGLRIGY
jgi:cytoskeletal protein RodZ